MRIVLIGGHLAPALSVLEALPKDADVLFIGRKYALEGDNALSLEYKTLTEMKVPFMGLNTGRLQRRITKYTLFSLLKLPIGFVKSFIALFTFWPDVVVGFGGYVSIPVIFSAWLLRIPVVIHEQTMEAGLSNRIVAPFADKICISWNSSRKWFPKKKTVLTGNPIRKLQIHDTEMKIFTNKLPTIYITGGSSGSHAINLLIGEIASELLESYNIIHQTGDSQEFNDYEKLHELKDGFPEHIRENYILQKFIDPSGVGDLINMSSLVITRSGVNTVTELILLEKPAILIPLPFSQKNEQLRNAQFIQDIGLGVVLEQKGLTGKKLLDTIHLMFKNLKNYKMDREKLGPIQGKAVHNIISVINYVTPKKTKTL